MLLTWTLLLACGADSKEGITFGDELRADTDTLEVIDEAPPLPDTDVDPIDSAPLHSGDSAEDTAITFTQEIKVQITADDAYTLWIDGQLLRGPSADVWNYNDTLVLEVPGRRRHVIAVHAVDVASVISGMLAAVWISGELVSVTGDGKWKAIDVDPADPTWTSARYDDSAWGGAPPCPPDEAGVWGTYWNADLLALGAQYTWTGSCRSLGQRWFRLVGG